MSWFLGGDRLRPGKAGIEINTTADTSELTILQLTEEHLGEYLVTARNAYGEDLATAVILLEGM